MAFSCCMNPITGKKDYLKEFKRAQAHIERNYISDFTKKNDYCVNEFTDFRNCIMSKIDRTTWSGIQISTTKKVYHDILCYLNKFVTNEIVYIMRKQETSEKLCDELNPYNILKEKMFDLFKKKNHDYGNSFVHFGTVGILVRIVDKLNRIINLQTVKEQKVDDESICDTLEDLYNYTILALIV